jgi:hypothetical protein
MDGGLAEGSRMVVLLAKEYIHAWAVSMHVLNHVCDVKAYD